MSTTLIVNAMVLVLDEAMTVHEPGWVELAGDTIVATGPGAPPKRDCAAIVDASGCLVMPGMVNPHTHMAMSVFRGLGEDVDDRLYRYILPIERKLVTPEMVRAGTALAALEMIQGGVTTLADMYYFETVVGEVLDRAGLRALVGQTLADFSPPDHRDFAEGFARVEALVSQFSGHPRITPSIAPHAPYSTGLAVMESIARWSADHPGVPVQIHLAESDAEVAWARDTHGLSSVEVTQRAGLLKPGLIAAHCLHLSDNDIALMAAAGVGVAHNARSNGKAGRGIAPIEKLRAVGVPVGIATDGAMSGNTLDLFSQFGPVSMFAKLLGRSRKPMPARQVIRMATIEGARVLGLDHAIGSLEPGKQADLIVLDLSAPRLHPIYDPYAMLVFAAMPTDVRHTMVAGTWLMVDRQVRSLDPQKTLADALQIASGFRAEIARIDAGQA